MNLRVIKSLATPSCQLVFAPAMGISTSSDIGRVETSNWQQQLSTSPSSSQHPPPRTLLSTIIIWSQPSSYHHSSFNIICHHHHSSLIIIRHRHPSSQSSTTGRLHPRRWNFASLVSWWGGWEVGLPRSLRFTFIPLSWLSWCLT